MSENNKSPISTAAGDTTSVAEAESKLNALWAKVAGSEGTNPVLRVTTLNLVLYTGTSDGVPTLLSELIEAHPCRAIVIQQLDEATEKLNTTPVLFYRQAIGSADVRQQVCCEEFLITTGPDTSKLVPGAVQSLLLSDLPAYIMRKGDLQLADTIFDSLAEVIDGLIVDSASFTSPADGLRTLSALIDAPHFHAKLYDLNWERLRPWRKALAQTFDPPVDRAALAKIRKVELVHNAGRCQALLYVGWLVSRMGWELVPGGRPDTWLAHAAHTDQADIEIHVRAVEGGLRGLQKVTVQADSRSYSIMLSEEGQHLVTSENHVQAQRLLSDSTGALIGAVVDSTGPDQTFEDALAVAAMLSDEVALPTQRAGVVIAADAGALARLAARYFVQAARASIDRHDRFTVALSGGSTPKALYQLLSLPPYHHQIEWAKVHIFWGDERNVPVTDPESNQNMARGVMINHVPIPPGNVHGILTGELSAGAAAARYAAEIRSFFKLEGDKLPEFDLIWLGLGEDGHTASLFPHSPALNAPDKDLFIANPVEKLKTTRLTLTAGVINEAARVVFLLSGKGKADIAYRVFKGPLQPDDLPSQRIKPADGSLVVMADQDAAAKLKA